MALDPNILGAQAAIGGAATVAAAIGEQFAVEVQRPELAARVKAVGRPDSGSARRKCGYCAGYF